jgi:hypothetical protein
VHHGLSLTIDKDDVKHVKINTDGSKMRDKVGYAVVKEEHTIQPQNTVCSAEQSTIIETIQSEKNNGHEIVKTAHQRRTPRHKLSERCWIMKNQELSSYGSAVKLEYQAAKKALEEDISTTVRYPPDDLKK